ncbi:MAG: metal-dependent transcriptional regulator [Treponema sp.]|nr:metal-dependent transcriptional regulator [Treponema sp.]
MYKSGEDYLETILILKEENNVVLSVDVANYMGFSKPSVSRAMSILERDGYIKFGLHNHIELTEKGLAKASDIYDRHRLLTEFLIEITGIPREQAKENACRVEHDIDADVVEGIKKFMENCMAEKGAEK